MTTAYPGTKVVDSLDAAVAGIPDSSVLLVGGWGGIGVPTDLITAIATAHPTDLTVVTNNCGMGRPGDVGELFRAGLVSHVIATYPTNPDALDFRRRFDNGEVDLEIVPQGTLAERLRSAGAGLGGFFTPTGAGTLLAEGRETRVIDGREQIFEQPLPGDFAIIRAARGDEMGNLRFHYAARGFNPVMAMAAATTIVQVDELVPLGTLDPDDVHLPGIFVDRIFVTGVGS